MSEQTTLDPVDVEAGSGELRLVAIVARRRGFPLIWLAELEPQISCDVDEGSLYEVEHILPVLIAEGESCVAIGIALVSDGEIVRRYEMPPAHVVRYDRIAIVIHLDL